MYILDLVGFASRPAISPNYAKHIAKVEIDDHFLELTIIGHLYMQDGRFEDV